MIEFDVTITAKDMYNYNVYHNYRNFNGIMGIIIGVICLCLCVAGAMNEANISYVLLMGFFGLFCTVITPVRIYLSSVRQVSMTPSFKKPLHYEVSDKTITISQDGQQAAFPIQEVWKVVDTGKSIVIYVNRVRAYIFPKRDLGEKETGLKELLRTVLSDKQYCIR